MRTSGTPSVAASYDHNGAEILDRETCLTLLSGSAVGRIGLSIDALPVILPVNFVVARSDADDSDLIVLRMGSGARLTAAMNHTVVAFETDGHDRLRHTGWSVLVQGRSRVIHDPSALLWASALPLRSWAFADTPVFVSVSLDVVSGRRFGVHSRVERRPQ
jgi:hypothetical protein